MKRILKIQIVILFSFLAIINFSSCSEDDDPIVATCTDGIQNGSEQGVDCGGTCSPCPSCTDGIQNGNETGVDCGGDCDDCPTCSDGIQNGNETDVDCGGDCPACIDLADLLPGLYRWTVFEIDGNSAFETFGFVEVYYKYGSNGAFETFNRQTNGSNNFSNGTFSVDNTNKTVSFTVGSNTTELLVEFPNGNGIGSFAEFRATNQNLFIRAEKIADNLCNQVDCNDGSCIYGYCECPSGVEGDNCEVTYGPGGGIVFYDKGSFTDGWRYIEVYPELQDELPISCSNVDGNFGIDGYGAGIVNTIQLSILCSGVNGHVANTALALNLNGFNDWSIPSRIELIEIYKFNKYLLEYPNDNVSYDIHNSLYDDGDHYWIKFRPNTYEGNISTVNLSRQYFVIRYF